jgi:hypothetical protein
MIKINLSILILFSIILATNLVIADPDDFFGCGMMNGVFGNYGATGIFLTGITYILFIGLMISGIYYFIKSANSKIRK